MIERYDLSDLDQDMGDQTATLQKLSPSDVTTESVPQTEPFADPKVSFANLRLKVSAGHSDNKGKYGHVWCYYNVNKHKDPILFWFVRDTQVNKRGYTLPVSAVQVIDDRLNDNPAFRHAKNGVQLSALCIYYFLVLGVINYTEVDSRLFCNRLGCMVGQIWKEEQAQKSEQNLNASPEKDAEQFEASGDGEDNVPAREEDKKMPELVTDMEIDSIPSVPTPVQLAVTLRARIKTIDSETTGQEAALRQQNKIIESNNRKIKKFEAEIQKRQETLGKAGEAKTAAWDRLRDLERDRELIQEEWRSLRLEMSQEEHLEMLGQEESK